MIRLTQTAETSVKFGSNRKHEGCVDFTHSSLQCTLTGIAMSLMIPSKVISQLGKITVTNMVSNALVDSEYYFKMETYPLKSMFNIHFL